MREVFFSADHHLGHENILKYESETRGHFSSIEEHDEYLIQERNAVVKKSDTVWHLGDVAFKKRGQEAMTRLNGLRRLVLGNHDVYNSRIYLESGFQKLFGTVSFKGIALLSHLPVHPDQLGYRLKFNFHGHCHGKSNIDDDRYVDVGVDVWDLRPVSWDELRKVIEKRQ